MSGRIAWSCGGSASREPTAENARPHHLDLAFGRAYSRRTRSRDVLSGRAHKQDDHRAPAPPSLPESPTVARLARARRRAKAARQPQRTACRFPSYTAEEVCHVRLQATRSPARAPRIVRSPVPLRRLPSRPHDRAEAPALAARQGVLAGQRPRLVLAGPLQQPQGHALEVHDLQPPRRRVRRVPHAQGPHHRGSGAQGREEGQEGRAGTEAPEEAQAAQGTQGERAGGVLPPPRRLQSPRCRARPPPSAESDPDPEVV